MKAPSRAGIWRWAALALGIALVAWVLRDMDVARFLRIVAKAELWPLLILPVAITAEQLVRAFKWRQLLRPLRMVRVWRLFGATMAGYLANLAAPVRVSPLVRAYLVARLEGLSTATLLATVSLDRLTDGLVFVAFTMLALAFAEFLDATGALWPTLMWAGVVSFVLFGVLMAGLFAGRRWFERRSGPLVPLGPTAWLPRSWREPVSGAVQRFFAGALWPQGLGLPCLIVGSAIAIKLLAIGHFFWVGLAFGVALGPVDYLFLMVFIGFIVILTSTLRLVGGFTAGAVYVLQGLGVDVETALAMTLTVQAISLATVAATGSAALWIQGVRLSTLLGVGGYDATQR